MRCSPTLAALFVALSAVPASADYETIAPVRPLTMADPAGLTVVGIDFQLTKWTVDAPVKADFTSLTFDLAADIRIAPHWVLLARVPFTRLGVDQPATSCCDLALDNLTLGGRGLWATVFGDGNRSVLGAELTVSLPTASDSDNRGLSTAGAALAHLPHDPGLWAPNVTTVRLTGISQFYGRYLLAHVETGLQLYFFDKDVAGDDHLDAGIRLAAALGIRPTYTLSILAELNALLVFSNDKFAPGDDTTSSLDLGIRYGSNRGIFGARVYVPLDPQLRDLSMLGFGLDAGLRF
jgi:hypothetical protein